MRNQGSISAQRYWIISWERAILVENNACFESFYATRNFIPCRIFSLAIWTFHSWGLIRWNPITAFLNGRC